MELSADAIALGQSNEAKHVPWAWEPSCPQQYPLVKLRSWCVHAYAPMTAYPLGISALLRQCPAQVQAASEPGKGRGKGRVHWGRPWGHPYTNARSNLQQTLNLSSSSSYNCCDNAQVKSSLFEGHAWAIEAMMSSFLRAMPGPLRR